MNGPFNKEKVLFEDEKSTIKGYLFAYYTEITGGQMKTISVTYTKLKAKRLACMFLNSNNI